MILTLVLALLPIAQKVEAVASEMAVVYFVYATIFGSCAVSFASDDNFRQGVKNFIGQASEVTKNIVNAKAVEMANNIASGLQLSGYKINFLRKSGSLLQKMLINMYLMLIILLILPLLRLVKTAPSAGLKIVNLVLS